MDRVRDRADLGDLGAELAPRAAARSGGAGRRRQERPRAGAQRSGRARARLPRVCRRSVLAAVAGFVWLGVASPAVAHQPHVAGDAALEESLPVRGRSAQLREQLSAGSEDRQTVVALSLVRQEEQPHPTRRSAIEATARRDHDHHQRGGQRVLDPAGGLDPAGQIRLRSYQACRRGEASAGCAIAEMSRNAATSGRSAPGRAHPLGRRACS